MSVINTNQFSSTFASPNVLSELESGAMPNQSGASFASPQSSDAIYRGNPITLPIQSPIFNGGGFGDGNEYGNGGNYGNSGWGSSGTGGFSFSGIMNEIGNIVNGLLAQLQSSLSSYAPPSYGGNQPSGDQQLFSNATASSNGDPHLAFDGTAANGTVDNTKWDSMTSHNNLLSSDSFSGGYRVSTTVTTANSKGITENENATVTTDGGAAAITMQKDGSYSVTENGQNVSLTKGQQTSLGNGETVELNSDGTLTVNDTNGQGGTLSTTLKSTGGGVDVSNTASNVDLGGYLVDKNDNDYDPVTNSGGISVDQPLSSPVNAAPAYGYGYTEPVYEQQANQTSQFEQFNPDEENANLSNIEYA